MSWMSHQRAMSSAIKSNHQVVGQPISLRKEHCLRRLMLVALLIVICSHAKTSQAGNYGPQPNTTTLIGSRLENLINSSTGGGRATVAVDGRVYRVPTALLNQDQQQDETAAEWLSRDEEEKLASKVRTARLVSLRSQSGRDRKRNKRSTTGPRGRPTHNKAGSGDDEEVKRAGNLQITPGEADITTSGGETKMRPEDKNQQLARVLNNLMHLLEPIGTTLLRQKTPERLVSGSSSEFSPSNNEYTSADVDLSTASSRGGRRLLAIDYPNRTLASQASGEDVHLLCKLLEKHFANTNLIQSTALPLQPGVDLMSTPKTPTFMLISSTTTSAPNETSESSSTTAQPSPTTADRYLRNINELVSSPDFERHLLETVLDAEPPRKMVNETDAERLLVHLFSTGWRERSPTGGGPSDYDYSADPLANPKQDTGLLSIKLWPPAASSSDATSKATTKHLHLIYWLLERRATDGRLRLLEAREAAELLDQLNHGHIRRQLGVAHLSTPGELVAPFNRSRWVAGSHDSERPPVAKTIDDTLGIGSSTSGPTQRQQQQQQPSSLQLFLDRITQFSFVDNLHLYLALFFFLLMVLLLCFAVPLICCSQRRGGRMGPPKGQRRRASGGQAPSTRMSPEQQHRKPSIRGAKQRAETLSSEKLADGGSVHPTSGSSIWRKLSSSTTTLVQDESRELRADGFYGIPMDQQQEWSSSSMRAPVSIIGAASAAEGSKKLDWCSFEDAAASSGQVRGAASGRQVSAGELLELGFAERQLERHSNTLTKSELVMLKEKLVPIVKPVQQQQQLGGATCNVAATTPVQTHSAASQTTDEPAEEEHLNKATQTSFEANSCSTDKATGNACTTDHWPHDSLASHYIDSTDASCAANLPAPQEARQTKAGGSKRIEQTSSSSTCSTKRQPKQRFVSSNQDLDSDDDDDDDNYKDRRRIEDTTYERQASVRGHVEFPAKTKAKLDAIKAELDRLERREQSQRQLFDGRLPSGATYKRFDV